jgi:hypothetical protein
LLAGKDFKKNSKAKIFFFGHSRPGLDQADLLCDQIVSAVVGQFIADFCAPSIGLIAGLPPPSSARGRCGRCALPASPKRRARARPEALR